MNRLICLILVIVSLPLCGCVPAPRPRPGPPPATEIDALCRQALDDYAEGLAAAFDDAASAPVADGATAHKSLAAANKAARDAAFKPIDKLLNQKLYGNHYDSDEAAALFGQLAAGFEKARPR